LLGSNTDYEVFGLWAYDATVALAMAVEDVGITNSGFKNSNASFKSTYLDTLTVSQYGPKLAQALSSTRFNGIGGDVSLIDGQLQSSTFKIVNINGDVARGIGFWTLQNGIKKTLGQSSANCSTLNCNLGPIIWPGDSFSVPKGWEIPTNGT
ncbi:hypothetical protein ABKV19_000057, partial [Rosa sericea]